MSSGLITPSRLPDWLLGQGRHFVTTAEVADLVGVEQGAVPVSLQRARDAHKIVSVTKGGWAPVPPEYRSAGAPPPIHYIDPLMGHLGHTYYVGFLSAARIHGASHQVPMVLQVVTPALLRKRRIGQHLVQFIRRTATNDRLVQQHNVDTGRVNIATVETTILDIVEAPELAAGLGNVGTILGDLAVEGRIDAALLAETAGGYPVTVIQRAGWMIEHMAHETDVDIDISSLAALVSSHDYTMLDPKSGREGERDTRWRVVINTEVEHDL